MADSMTVLRKAGPPGTKRNIAVLGDGFAAADQGAYNDWVDNVLIKGVFGHDYYSEDASGLQHLPRQPRVGATPGVSIRTYDEHGTPADPSDDTIASADDPQHALGIHLQRLVGALLARDGANTETLLQAALNTWVPDYNEVAHRPEQPELRRLRRRGPRRTCRWASAGR